MKQVADDDAVGCRVSHHHASLADRGTFWMAYFMHFAAGEMDRKRLEWFTANQGSKGICIHGNGSRISVRRYMLPGIRDSGNFATAMCRHPPPWTVSIQSAKAA